jgi:hypothetical protein
VAIFAIGALWSVGWFVLQSQANAQLNLLLANMSAQGVEIDCADRAINGYPFRLELSCGALNLGIAGAGDVETGPLVLLSQVYNPFKVLALIDQGVSAEFIAPDIALRSSWEQARASAGLTMQGPENISVSLNKLDLDLAPSAAIPAFVDFKSSAAEFHLRHQPAGASSGTIEIAVRMLRSQSNIFNLDPADLLIELSITPDGADAGSLIAAGRNIPGNGASIAVQKVEIATDGLRIQLSGNLTADSNGILDGKLAALGHSYRPFVGAVFAHMTSAELDNFMELIKAFSTEATLDGQPARLLPLQVRQGTIYAGFWPLGTVPALW